MPEVAELPGDPTQPYTPTFTTGSLAAQPAEAPPPAPAHPVVVPGTSQHLSRWTFVVVVAAVWVFAAAAGWGLYQWWYQAVDKTAPVFVVLLFVITTTVVGLLVALAPNRPVVAALAIAVTSAPMAAVAGAAVLHGLYFCEYASRCLVGLIPY